MLLNYISKLSLRSIYVYYLLTGLPLLVLIGGLNLQLLPKTAFAVGFMTWLLLYQPLIARLRRMMINNHRILAAKAEAEELTYDYISREIHDNINLGLVISKLQLYELKTCEESNRIPKIDGVIELITTSLTQLTQLSRSLSIEKFRTEGVFFMLQQDVWRINSTGLLNVNYEETGALESFELEREIQVYRIIQECLNNILKHAHAKNCQILLDYQPKQLELSISDDGEGFDTTASGKKSWSSGLTNMQARARLLNARFTLTSAPGKGTTVSLIVPYRERTKNLFRFPHLKPALC